MKILIIDDTPSKAELLHEEVTRQSCGVNFEIKICDNAHAAFAYIKAYLPDLILLDVMLPYQKKGEATDSASRWLIREIERKITLENQPVVVGVTQYSEARDAVRDEFGRMMWNVLIIDRHDGEWKRWIGYAIHYAGKRIADTATQNPDISADAVVITALRSPEFNAVVEAFGAGERIVRPDTCENWMSRVIKDSSGVERRLLFACAEGMGMSLMSALTTRICLAAKPRFLILTGIMGGNSQEVGLTDLIAVEETWDCNAGKLVAEGLRPDVKCLPCDIVLKNTAIGLLDKSFFLQVLKDWRGEERQTIPKFHHGAVACSPAVLAFDGAFTELSNQKRKVLGVEMEAFGCYAAAQALGGGAPRTIALKAICDLGDSKKNDEAQRFSAYVSARAALELLTAASVWSVK